MQALDRKLLRDFRRLWAQALAIALVLACGVAIFITSFGMYRALEETRIAYYERNRFADVFSDARRAPLSLAREIETIEGVWAVETRVSGAAILDIPGRSKSAVGRILSIPSSGRFSLNVPLLRSGHVPDPETTDQVLVNEPFAQANGFQIGDVFAANLNGQKRQLTITGTVLSPEFIYTIGPGGLMPDNEGYGIIWMPEDAVAAAFDMTGAFNHVSLKLRADARTETVISSLDNLLEPYGGLDTYDRSQQQSDAFIDAEIKQLRSTSIILPPVFFGITAFLVNMVIGRIIALERSEIGLLKAIGYSNFDICLHYLLLAGLIAVVGIVIGWGVGSWLSQSLARLYADFFNFPFLIYRVSYDAYIISGIIGVTTAAVGAIRSVLNAARLAPAVAMSPPAPPKYKRNTLDHALLALRLSQPTMMIFRNLMRWPVRSALTTLGLSLAVSILVAATFFDDSLDTIVDTAFYQSNRQDAVLTFTDEMHESVLEDVRRLPGVLQAESKQYYPATLRNGHLSKRIAIESSRPNPDLSRVIDSDGRVVHPPANGIMLSDRLASELNVRAGDTIAVDFLSGRRESHEIMVAGTVTQYLGLGAYMDMDGLSALFRQKPRVGIVNVTLDGNQTDNFHAALKEAPNLAGTTMMTETRQSFLDTIRQNVIIMTTIYVIVATLITVGVAYNGARIQLSERARELASLRILGFTRGEVSYILMGETMILALLAQPLGWLIGVEIARLMTNGFTSDLYTIPLILKPATFSFASLVVLTAALAATLVVRRRLDRLNLVAVMKTRE